MAVRVEIITPERTLPVMEADHVTLPAFDSEVGIRTGHAAFVCLLGEGELHLKGPGERSWKMRGGVAEVSGDELRILAEWIDWRDEAVE